MRTGKEANTGCRRRAEKSFGELGAHPVPDEASFEFGPSEASTPRRKYRPLLAQPYIASGLPVKVHRKGLAMVSLK